MGRDVLDDPPALREEIPQHARMCGGEAYLDCLADHGAVHGSNSRRKAEDVTAGTGVTGCRQCAVIVGSKQNLSRFSPYVETRGAISDRIESEMDEGRDVFPVFCVRCEPLNIDCVRRRVFRVKLLLPGRVRAQLASALESHHTAHGHRICNCGEQLASSTTKIFSQVDQKCHHWNGVATTNYAFKLWRLFY